MVMEAVAEAVDRLETKVKDVPELRQKVKDVEDRSGEYAARIQHLEQLAARANNGGGGWVSDAVGVQAKVIETFVQSDGFRSLRSGQSRAGRVMVTEVPVKKALVTDGGLAGSDDTSVTVQPTFVPGLFGYARRPLRLFEVLIALPVTSGSVTYNQLVGYSNAADYQEGEGTDKPLAVMDTVPKTASIATIAHLIPVSKQALADEPMLESSIASLLGHGVADKAERELINGAGGQFKISGLIMEGTAFSATTDKLADAVGECEAEMRGAGYSPGVILLNPLDWHEVRSERATGGSEEYVAGGWSSPAPPSMWGLPVITSAAVPRSTPIVVDLGLVRLLDRMEVVVEMFEQDATNVRQNLITARAECRIGLMVVDANAVRVIELPGSSGP